MRVHVGPAGLYTYPDIVVVAGEGQYEDAEADTLLNPTVIIEVLSPSTEAYDRGDKFARYRRLDTLREYVLVAQERVLIERYARQGEEWVLTEFTRPGRRPPARLDRLRRPAPPGLREDAAGRAGLSGPALTSIHGAVTLNPRESTPPRGGPPDHDRDDASRALARRGRGRRRAGRATTGGSAREIGKVIVGQEEVVEQLLTGLFARGHVLLVGVPGLAKTLLVSTVSRILSLSFRRIQFTPDMMPSDITGTDILQDDPETGRRRFAFIAGPLFANIILADEINRTPPKTQAALLEAMQERHVTAGNRTYPLPDPFFVLATQNPIEQEGTYPLPEAQLDRFMLNVRVPYPTADEELEILRQTTGDGRADAAGDALGRADRGASSTWSGGCRCPSTSSSTPATSSGRAGRTSPRRRRWSRSAWPGGRGLGPGRPLILAAKARAVLDGRFAATIADVRHVARPVLRHRIVTTFHAEAEGIDPDKVVAHLLEAIVPAPPERAAARSRSGLTSPRPVGTTSAIGA